MDDLIKREDAIKALYKYSFVSKDVIEREINAIPSADRPSGEWDREDEYGDLWVCNQCGLASEYRDNFCPNCGADMRKRDCGMVMADYMSNGEELHF